MNKLNIIFCGTPEISSKILETLIKMEDVNVKLIISQPDKVVGRKKILTKTKTKEMGIKYNIDVLQPNKIKDIYDKLKNIEFDLLITCAYGQFIPTNILDLAKINSINIHASLLPKYRGGAPIQYAIKNGDKKTGISIMKMEKEMDAGDYYIQKEIDILDSDDYGSVLEKLTILASDMVRKYLFKIAKNEFSPIKQNEKLVTFSKNISSNDEKINWNTTSFDIYNFVRSLSPTPIAHTFNRDDRYKISKVEIINKYDNKYDKHIPGEIIEFNNNGILVKTKDGIINIIEIQRPGKKTQPANIYFKNKLDDLKVGDIFK